MAGGTRLHKITSAIGVIDGKEYVDYVRSNVDLSKRMGLLIPARASNSHVGGKSLAFTIY